MTPPSDSGIAVQRSNHSVEETIRRLQDMLGAKGIKQFALIDHSGEAEAAGLSMRPTKVLIFGNPKAGTPLMLAAPLIALDLPLKILVWEDDQGVWLAYNQAAYLQRRYGFPEELLRNIALVEALAAEAAR